MSLAQKYIPSGVIGSPRDDFAKYLAGEKLYGDDFSTSQIEEWFEDEKEAYYDLGDRDPKRYVYEYHALNYHHGFRFLPPQTFRQVLGVGSAYGEELRPIAANVGSITIIDSSESFKVSQLAGKPVEFARAQFDGRLPFADEVFDLAVCFEVLHHVANVTTLVNEVRRCLLPGGYALLCEPIISMGDWRRPRQGLTKRERGIPLNIFREIIGSGGLQVLRERKCMFSLTSRLRYIMHSPVYNSRLCTALDAWICRLPFWPKQYHARFAVQKLRPRCVFYVVRKPPLS